VAQGNPGDFKVEYGQEGFSFETNPAKKFAPWIAQQIGSSTRYRVMSQMQAFLSNAKVKTAVMKDLLMESNQTIDIEISKKKRKPAINRPLINIYE
jgi:hypothetical protein